MRILLSTALVAATLFWVGPAQAKQPAEWGFEIRLGTYRPAFGSGIIEGTTQGEKAYYDVFYDRDSRPLMIGVEFDRYFLDVLGPIGMFVQVGHWKVTGNTRVCSDGTGTVPCTRQTIFASTAGADKTQLQILPLSAGAVYRFEGLMRLHVPLMISLKAGLDYFYWWESDKGNTLGSTSGVGSSGGTLGMHGAIALALNLDWIASDTEHVLYRNSFVFAELTGIWANGFGDDERFDMSDTQVNFGVSFDFD